MFHPTELRVRDRELSTLGHSLADVAFNCIAWCTLPSAYGGIRGLDLEAVGIASAAEYLWRYYTISQRSDGVTAFNFAFALFRLAVILEGIAARAADGSAAADNATKVGGLRLAVARRAVEFVNERVQAPNREEPT
jgi:aminoglycoside phosphotransferase (APT) family kinase protein